MFGWDLIVNLIQWIQTTLFVFHWTAMVTLFHSVHMTLNGLAGSRTLKDSYLVCVWSATRHLIIYNYLLLFRLVPLCMWIDLKSCWIIIGNKCVCIHKYSILGIFIFVLKKWNTDEIKSKWIKFSSFPIRAKERFAKQQKLIDISHAQRQVIRFYGHELTIIMINGIYKQLLSNIYNM